MLESLLQATAVLAMTLLGWMLSLWPIALAVAVVTIILVVLPYLDHQPKCRICRRRAHFREAGDTWCSNCVDKLERTVRDAIEHGSPPEGLGYS